MTTTEQIEISLSKGKLTKILISSIAFVAIGLWFVISPPTIQNGLFGNPILILVAGIASILFFGFCAFLIFKKFTTTDKLMFISAMLSLVFSEILYFQGNKEDGIFIGIWVPSILAFGIYLKLINKEK